MRPSLHPARLIVFAFAGFALAACGGRGGSSAGAGLSGLPPITSQGMTSMAVKPTLPPLAPITEYAIPTANSGPNGITAGPDGSMWFTEYNTANIGRVTMTGSMSDTNVPPTNAQAEPFQIAVGADNALWYTESNGTGTCPRSGIGRITTSFANSEITTNIDPCSSPWGIAADAAGNLWFAEHDANIIAKVTPGHDPMPVATLAPDTQPEMITKGPDGAMWFTEGDGNKIGRIDPTTGNVSEFGAGFFVPGSLLFDITTGPDGNLWFTEYFADKIGRITPSGSITEFPVPAGSGPNGITKNPDGNLYFTAYNTGQIGRITTSGVVTEFPIPTDPLDANSGPNSWPNLITTGPDGNLWFTENNDNKIGRAIPSLLVVATPAPSPSPGTCNDPDGKHGIDNDSKHSGIEHDRDKCKVDKPKKPKRPKDH